MWGPVSSAADVRNAPVKSIFWRCKWCAGDQDYETHIVPVITIPQSQDLCWDNNVAHLICCWRWRVARHCCCRCGGKQQVLKGERDSSIVLRRISLVSHWDWAWCVHVSYVISVCCLYFTLSWETQTSVTGVADQTKRSSGGAGMSSLM